MTRARSTRAVTSRSGVRSYSLPSYQHPRTSASLTTVFAIRGLTTFSLPVGVAGLYAEAQQEARTRVPGGVRRFSRSLGIDMLMNRRDRAGRNCKWIRATIVVPQPLPFSLQVCKYLLIRANTLALPGSITSHNGEVHADACTTIPDPRFALI